MDTFTNNRQFSVQKSMDVANLPNYCPVLLKQYYELL